jgi:flagella basal body P-ring formation protein FlgA
VPAGQPLLARMVKPRNVVHRGQRADALVQDGALSIRTQVLILEDGAPGQIVHAVNSVTHRDLMGTVLNDRTILVSL